MKYLMVLSKSNESNFPKTFGFAHRKKYDEINCQGFYISNQYIKAFSKAL
jgi:hypothetical protein